VSPAPRHRFAVPLDPRLELDRIAPKLSIVGQVLVGRVLELAAHSLLLPEAHSP
jgi:hypothetical protein